ncbi:MAG: RNA polymerase sigma factor [Pseudomonadota bacterium]
MKKDLEPIEHQNAVFNAGPVPSLETDASAAPSSEDAQHDMEALYRTHAKDLSSSLRKAFGDGPPDPDDIAQQAFQKLIERERLSDIRNLKGFLWRTARNLVLNAKRSRSTRAKYDFEIEQLYFPSRGGNSSPEAVLSAKEELRAINAALRAMPEKRRRAFILHRVEGLSVSEVARRLRISRSPADRHIMRAAEDIQVCLANLRGGQSDD